jgi:multicomponent Na+:H+ antiporter subunit E
MTESVDRQHGEEADVEAVDAGRRHIPLLQQLPLLVALVLVWMALWGSVTPLTILTGVVVALVVTRAFFLPPVELSGRVNILWLLAFLGRFAGELILGSFQVALLAFTPRAIPHSAVVRVHLRTRADIILTLTSITISLVPGSLVIEVDRRHAVLYVHVLGAERPEDVEEARRHTLSIERLLIAAIGSRAEWEEVR